MVFLFVIGKDIPCKSKRVADILDTKASQFSGSEILQHNAVLIATLQNRESTERNVFAMREGYITHMRGIYIGIMGILISFLLSYNGNKHWGLVTLLFIILLFYSLDIHLKDLSERSSNNSIVTSDALNNLINQNPNSTVCYELNFIKKNDIENQMHKTRFKRKSYYFVHPAIDQLILFILPLVIFYTILFYLSVIVGEL